MFSGIRFRRKDFPIVLIVCTFVLQVFFFAPLQIWIQNSGEFPARFFDLLLVFLTLSFVLILLLYLLVHLFRTPVVPAVFVFLSVIAFVESRFFLGFANHHPFDGTLIDWQALQWLSYLELGTIFTLGILIFALRKRTLILSYGSFFILLFLTLGFLLGISGNVRLLHDDHHGGKAQALYFDKFYRLSNRRNVIHIVPDQTQGAMLHELLASKELGLSEMFDGFTLFVQAIGRYQSTYPNLPWFMAGEAPEPKFDLVSKQPFTHDYMEEVLRERSVVTALSQNEFQTYGFQLHPGLFCKGSYTACTGSHEEVFDGITINSNESRVLRASLTAMNVSLFQMTPVVLRKRIFSDGRWFMKDLVTVARSHSGILDMFIENMETIESPGSYNYFHHAGAHAPILFDRNCKYLGPQAVDWDSQREQVICTLGQLGEMIKALKRIGIYDQTMIVIHGDHGTPWLPPSYPTQSGKRISRQLIGSANTLVLIKPPEARGALQFSNLPVTTGDIPATIMDTLGLENTYTGVRMFKGEPVPNRERHYYTYDSPTEVHILQALPNVKRYRIRGNVFNELNWVQLGTSSHGPNPSRLRMDYSEFSVYSEGFSWLEQHDVPVRWVDGKQARLFLSPPQTGPIKLVFDSFLPSFIKGQWMEVAVNGNTIARLDENMLVESHHEYLLPDDLPWAKTFEIDFTLGKTRSTRKDPRRLSMLFSYIGLEPEDP